MLEGRHVVGSSGGCTADGRPSEKYLSVFCFFFISVFSIRSLYMR